MPRTVGLRSAADGAAQAPFSRVAVVPFLDLTPGQDHDYLCAGMAEEVASALSRVADLRVTVLSRLNRRSSDALEMGRLLGVPAILDGSVRRAGDRARVTVRLIDVSDGAQLWSDRFDRPIEDVFGMQDDVARAVADAFGARLEPARRPTRMPGPEAYTAYLRGRYFWERRYEDGLNRAMEFFSQALGLEPTMAEAHVGRADCLVILGHYGLMDPRVAYSQAREATQHALRLNPDQAEAHATMGWISAFSDHERGAADSWFRRAIQLDSNYATAHEWNSIHLVSSHRPGEALRSIREAQRLAPLSLMIRTILGWIRHELGNDDEAFRILHNALEMDPRFVFAHNVLAVALLANDRADEAIATLERGAMLAGTEGLTLAMLGYAYGRSGRNEDADRILEQLHEAGSRRYVAPLHFAFPHLGVGRIAESLDLIEQAVDQGDTFLASMHFSHLFDGIQEHPRFREVVRRVAGPG